VPETQKKSFMLDKGYIPLINCIIENMGIESFDDFITMSIDEFILTNSHVLPADLQSIPKHIKNQRIRLLIDKEIESINSEVGFIEDIRTKLSHFGKCNATIDYYAVYYLSCKKKLLTYSNKKKLLIRMNKTFKDHLQTIINLESDTNEIRNPLKHADILKFIRSNILKDKKEFEGFVLGIKDKIKVIT